MQNQWIIFLFIAWTLPWKGVALWKAAKSGKKIWFIIIFLFNTMAVLDIIFIIFFSKNKEEEISKISPMVLGNGKRIV